MSGRLPRTTGCLQYGQDLSPGHDTFAWTFSRHGWQTTACGKLHHMGPDQMQGWSRRIGGDTTLGEAYIARVDDTAGSRATGRIQLKWNDAKEAARAGVGRGSHITKDEYPVAGALDFIDEYFSDPYYDQATPTRPVLLKVSLLQPHYPYLADPDLFTYYLNLDPPVKLVVWVWRNARMPLPGWKLGTV